MDVVADFVRVKRGGLHLDVVAPRAAQKLLHHELGLDAKLRGNPLGHLDATFSIYSEKSRSSFRSATLLCSPPP